MPRKLGLRLTLAVAFGTVAVISSVRPAKAEGPRHGALAHSSSAHKFGISVNHKLKLEAEAEALKTCGHLTCRIVLSMVDECGAYAEGDNEAHFGWAKASTEAKARTDAVDACTKAGGKSCAVRTWGCTNDAQPSARPKFVATTTPAGVPNLVEIAPHMWRMGEPPTDAAWRELASRIAPSGGPVVVVKLNDEREGSDDAAEKLLGWTVVRIPIPPEDDKPFSVLVKPQQKDVNRIVQTILDAHAKGTTVAWHCTHGRDRTGLVSALVGRSVLGWSKQEAWDNMIAHGFRWELPGLDAYWLEDVPKH